MILAFHHRLRRRYTVLSWWLAIWQNMSFVRHWNMMTLGWKCRIWAAPLCDIFRGSSYFNVHSIPCSICILPVKLIFTRCVIFAMQHSRIAEFLIIIIMQCTKHVVFVLVCTGTSFGLRRTGHAGNWSLRRYMRLYENCVYINGNLEITYLENGSYDLSFLSSIQEVKFVRLLYYIYFS